MCACLCTAVLSFLLVRPAPAQELAESLAHVGEAYARAYVAPLAEALASDLNAGLFHTAHIGDQRFGFNIYVGVKASAAFLSAQDQAFDLEYQGTVPIEIDFEFSGERRTINVPATFVVSQAPTIFGDTEAGTATASVRHDTTFNYLGLSLPVSIDTTLAPEMTIGGMVKTNVAPFLVPHAVIGTVLGTDLLIRWVPQISQADFGAIELFGLGLRHNLNQYLPGFPLDVSIQAAWQRVRAEDADGAPLVDASTFAANAEISKRFGILTLYGGFQTEQSDIDFSYTFLSDDPDIPDVPIEFRITQLNKTRGIVGVGLNLGPVHTNADVSLGNATVVSAGLGVMF